MERRITTDSFYGGNVDERLLRRGDACDEKVIQAMLGTFGCIDDSKETLQNRNAYTKRYIGGIRLFHTFCREGDGSPYRYAGLCPYGGSGNLHPRAGKRTFIISQCHADTDKEAAFNRRFAAALARDIARHGDFPVAPHLYFPSFLGDSGFWRDFGIEAGHMMMDHCDSVLAATIDGRVSEGMRADLDYATVSLALEPRFLRFTRSRAEKYIMETENEAYEERKQSEHR